MRMPALGLVAFVALAVGCGKRPLASDDGGSIDGDLGLGGAGSGAAATSDWAARESAAASDLGARREEARFTQTRKLDMLFVIDDSSHMRSVQENLLGTFRRC